MQVNDFIFPVETTSLWYGKKQVDTLPVDSHKGIVRKHEDKSDELISVVSQSYTLLPNEKVIESTIGVLENSGIKYAIDSVGSYLSNKRMILHAIFSDVVLNDGESNVNLSMLIHNSYDMSTAFRFKFGTFRWICSNGAVIGYKELADTVYRKHTQGIYIEDIEKAIHNAVEIFPEIEKRIKILQQKEFTKAVKPKIINMMGKQYEKFMAENYEKRWREIKTLYQLYQSLTWYVTHKVTPLQRELYLNKIAKVFEI